MDGLQQTVGRFGAAGMIGIPRHRDGASGLGTSCPMSHAIPRALERHTGTELRMTRLVLRD